MQLNLVSPFVFCRSSKTSLSIYKDADSDTTSGNQSESDKSKPEFGSWLMLGGRAERNKENNSLPGKWAKFKVLPLASKTKTKVFLQYDHLLDLFILNRFLRNPL